MIMKFRRTGVGCAVLALVAAPFLHAETIGQFEQQTDIGAVHLPGNAVYDGEKQEYTITASGTNMWTDHDEFHYVWRKISGDFMVQASVKFVGAGANPHRKAGIIIRASLDPKSPHVNAAVHGNEMTSLQFRRTDGATTEQFEFETKGIDTLQLSRHGKTYTLSAAREGEMYTTKSFSEITLPDSVYVGIYVCAHDNTLTETARFHNVRLIRPAREGFKPYHDYIGSDLEVMDVSTGLRRIVHHVDDSMQAPNWTPDAQHLIVNHNGRMYRFRLKDDKVTPIDTGYQTQCNNDHALSFDGTMLGISSGQPSTVYILPAGGGTPKKITEKNPSYFHCWSPDGKFLLYTGIRGTEADIYRISPEGGAEEQLTTAKGLDDGAEYTPDGKYIFFISDRTGRMQIWRMRADGSEQTQITHDDFNNWFPHVSPDGKSFVFITYGPEIASNDHPFYKQVYLRELPIDGHGEPKVVAYLYGGQGSFNVNSWSPDSRSIAFVSNTDRL